MLVHERELQQKYYQANQLWTGAIFNQIMFKMFKMFKMWNVLLQKMPPIVMQTSRHVYVQAEPEPENGADGKVSLWNKIMIVSSSW